MNICEETEKNRYPRCNIIEEREDIIFVYPNEFNNDPNIVVNRMQDIINFLKRITKLSPSMFFAQRVVVGYRHLDDKEGHETQPIWTKNRVSIPWSYLGKPDEPLGCCTHELVHPFFRCSPLHNRNEGWGEGFCEFLRGPIKKILGLDGEAWWNKMIECTQSNTDSSYCYPAGQLVLNAYADYKLVDGSKTIGNLIKDEEAISAFVRFLFSNFQNVSLSTYLNPSPGMIKRWKDKGKI